METNFKDALNHILEWEGGFVNHPADPGGATNRGITLATYSAHVGRPVTVAELRAIDHATVEAIYRTRFWNAVHGDDLPGGIDLATFDWAVLTGPARARRHLQAALRVTQDGIFGPITRYAWQLATEIVVIADLTAIRADFLDDLSHFSTFGRGWSRRTVATYWAARALSCSPM